MGSMKKRKKLTQEEIDDKVIAQVDDDSAWEEEIFVKAKKTPPISIPTRLAAKAAFFAQLHKAENLAEWLQKIIQERVDFEEAAFISLKKELSDKRKRVN